jgi:hypothetical protein
LSSDRTVIPFHVKLSIEGLALYAWTLTIVDKVMCDEVVIHHVEEVTRKKIDQRAYQCWAFCKDPLRIPETVFLTLIDHDTDPFS